MTTHVGAMVGLRWRMIRSGGTRAAIVTAGVAVGWGIVGLIATRDSLPAEALAAIIQVAPATYLSFAVLALVSPLTSQAGAELFPAEQLVAYPVSPATRFRASLLLAPVNLVWILQLFALLGTTVYLVPRGLGLVAALMLTAAYIAVATTLGHALSWLVIGVRTTRWGALTVRTLIALAAVGVVLVIREGRIAERVNELPLNPVIRILQLGTDGRWGLWLLLIGDLVALLAALMLFGTRACAWALRRGAQVDRRDAQLVRRRQPGRSALRELIAADRASIWRSTPLRRGAIVLGFLPAFAAIGLGLPWRSLAILPGLVAAGAGLLFGVNMFCLDGGGATWLATMPIRARLVALSKIIVTAETVAAGVAITTIAGALRTPGDPSAVEVSAVVASALSSIAVVTALCLRMSLTRPHRADLLGPRDAPAPPVAMLAHSAQLTLATMTIGLVFVGMLATRYWALPALGGICFVALAGVLIRAQLRRWDDPHIRAGIVSAVSAG